MGRIKPEVLLRLYPRRWRDRYGDEFLALLEQEGTSRRVVINVMAGAFDAWVSPGAEARMAVNGSIGPGILWKAPHTTRRKFEPGSLPYFVGAVVAGLIAHGVGQLVHPGRMAPISFLAGFMSAWQVWVFRAFGLRTRVAAVVWAFVILMGLTWAAHAGLHGVYRWFGYET